MGDYPIPSSIEWENQDVMKIKVYQDSQGNKVYGFTDGGEPATDKEQKAEDKEQKAEDKEHEKGTDCLDPVWVNGHVRSMLVESTRVEETSSEEDEEPEPRKRKKQKKCKE